MSATERSCKEQLGQHYKGRVADIRALWEWRTGQHEDATEAECKDFMDMFDTTIKETVSRPDVGDEEWREFAREFADERFNEYGLSWDYVAPGTFEGQRRGYFRWQLSWGGPSDEFRFFVDENFGVCRVEYWFIDWFDGARRVIRRGADFDLLSEIWEDIRDMDMPRHWMDQAE
jgi:hypothetical protein